MKRKEKGGVEKVVLLGIKEKVDAQIP